MTKRGKKAASSELEGEIEALLMDLVQGFAAHLYMARQELEQTRAILDDAVTRLMPVFTVFRRGADDPRLLREGGGFGAELEAVTRRALPAMQFHDMSSQLLAHTQVRFDTFLTELERLSLGVRGASSRIGPGEMARLLGEMRSTLNRNMNALDRRLRKPVSRDDMASGEIDMF